MRRAIFAWGLGFLTLAVSLTSANEPGWSDEERAERSTAVFIGRVVSIERVENLSDRVSLRRAVVEVESVSKAGELIGGPEDRLALYFEHPKSGQTGERCPTYVSLDKGQRGCFYVRLRKVGTEWRAFLEMGSDVGEALAPAAGPR